MQKLVRNRTKLKTPPDLASYARAKTQNFISKYKKSHGHLYEDGLIYTQPYSSDHYSEPINIHVAKHRLNRKKPTTDAYTSIGSSDLFLSSNSVSVPIVNSTTNTTTHQYDEASHSIAIQTTDSLLKSSPIFGTGRRRCNCSWRSCNCSSTLKKSTIRVKKSTCDNQQQTVPQSVAYVLTFDRVKEPSPAPSPPPVFTKRSSEVSSQNTASTHQTLQDHLKSSRPTFISHAEQRRKCLNELNNLRKQRNEQRNKLFALSGSNSSLRNHLNYINPPPMQSKRIFTTKLLKKETKRRCRNLPEKVHKEQVERENRIRKGTRIIRDIFNRNLQRRVLQGEVNLSNSITVAPI